MRKLLFSLCLGVSLAACQVSTGNPQLDAAIVRIQAMAKQACGITVVAAQVVQFVPVNPALVNYVQIVNQLCAPILASARLKGAPLGTVQGQWTVNVKVGQAVVAVTVRK